MQTVTPNLYQLSGQHLHVSYSTASLDGTAILTYQDAHQAKSFRDEEIGIVHCDLGTLVSVTLRMTADLGSTTFSLFIPRMQIAEGDERRRAHRRSYDAAQVLYCPATQPRPARHLQHHGPPRRGAVRDLLSGSHPCH
jgi:hypothetical protein